MYVQFFFRGMNKIITICIGTYVLNEWKKKKKLFYEYDFFFLHTRSFMVYGSGKKIESIESINQTFFFWC